ncbi:MAG TPA: Gldg family protein [Stellaceae bacterium]|nr:Gldg family protein [Stellaceae bacterium]
MSRRITIVVALAAAAVLFVAVNIIAGRWLGATRLDLTQQHLYTLSAGTKKTLARIDEPITLRFYYSPRLGDEIPTYGVYEERVREMLNEYVAAAKGKIKLEILDPEPFSTTEDRAVALGLRGAPLDQSGDQVYFGLAASNSTDDEDVIPFFRPQREHLLEYDVTKLIYSVAFPKKAVVGLVTALPLEGDMMAALQGQEPQSFAVIDQLRELYTLRTLSTEFDKVPDDVDVLLIAHPQNLSDKTLYAIDQFVLKGGKALVFVDPYSEIQAAHPNRMAPSGPGASDLGKLFTAWGVEMEKGKVAADLDSALEVTTRAGGRLVNLPYIAWLGLKEGNINRDDPITADITTVNLGSAGILSQLKGAKTKFEPLLTTSTDAEELPVAQVEAVPDLADLLNGFKSEGKTLTLAARITGIVDTAFPDGPPVAAAAKDKKPAQTPIQPAPQIKTSVQPIDVVVVADSDILDDRFWAQVQNTAEGRVIDATAGNGDFVANAIDVLSGSVDLMGLRTRGTSARPFEVVKEIQAEADRRFQAQETKLEKELNETKSKITAREGKEPGQPNVALTADETKTIDDFRKQMLRIRQELRQVKLNQRQDLDRLKAKLEFFDIAAVPLLVGAAAGGLGILRMQRRKRRAQTG